MELTLLGTGSAMPTGRHYQAGYLLQTEDTRVLIDCGAGTLQRLATQPEGYTDLDAVVLTHHHLDHVNDLLALLKARWLARAGSLPIYGPPGTTALLEDLLDAHGYLAGNVSYGVTDLQPVRSVVAGLEVDIIETEHSMQCFAYRIAGPDGDLTLGGDGVATDHLARFADGSALLVHDCSFPDGTDTTNHPTPTQLGRALADATFGRVVLTHLYPDAVAAASTLCRTVGDHVDAPVDIVPDGTTLLVR